MGLTCTWIFIANLKTHGHVSLGAICMHAATFMQQCNECIETVLWLVPVLVPDRFFFFGGTVLVCLGVILSGWLFRRSDVPYSTRNEKVDKQSDRGDSRSEASGVKLSWVEVSQKVRKTSNLHNSALIPPHELSLRPKRNTI